MIDQAKKLREMARQKKTDSPVRSAQTASVEKTSLCRSIAVTSGKGGVGKSNTAISLGISLSRLNKRVLIFDGDLGLANLHILLGIAPKYNLSHVLHDECTLNQTLCAGPGGVTIVPGASGILSIASIESLQLEALIRALVQLESSYDFLIIDGGAGIAQASIQLSSGADTVLLVVTPEPTSLADAYATAKILYARGVTKINCLINMVESDQEGKEVFEKLQGLIKKFIRKELVCIGIVPFDKQVSKFIRAQKNICLEKPNSLVASRIQNVARSLCGIQPVQHTGFFNRLFMQQLRKGL